MKKLDFYYIDLKYIRDLSKVDLVLHKNDKPEIIAQKILMQKQLKWCRKNVDIIENRANKVYKLVVNSPDKNRNLVRRSSKFLKLESTLDKLLEKKKK